MDATPITYGQLIRLPKVLALLSATGLSRLADRIFAIAIVFHALAAFRSPAIAGWIAFAAVAPGLLISPLAGVLLDRAGAISAITCPGFRSARRWADYLRRGRHHQHSSPPRWPRCWVHGSSTP
jgi:hypothetical protein